MLVRTARGAALVAFAVATAAVHAQAAVALPPEAIRSVVRIRGFECGTGFLLETGELVTNAHVVSGACRSLACDGVPLHVATAVGAEATEELKVMVKPRLVSDALDLVILTVEGEGARPGFFRLGGPPAVGQVVSSLGFPDCGPLRQAQGIVREIDAITYVTSAQVRGGESGGPVFDDQGRLVGMNRQITSGWGSFLKGVTGRNAGGPARNARIDSLGELLAGGGRAARALVDTAARFHRETIAASSGLARAQASDRFNVIVVEVQGDLVALGEPGGLAAAVLATPLWRLPALSLGEDEVALAAERVAIARRLEADGKLPRNLLPNLAAAGRPEKHIQSLQALLAAWSPGQGGSKGFVEAIRALLVALATALWGFSVGWVLSRTTGRWWRRAGVTVAVALVLWPLSLVAWGLVRWRRRGRHSAR